MHVPRKKKKAAMPSINTFLYLVLALIVLSAVLWWFGTSSSKSSSAISDIQDKTILGLKGFDLDELTPSQQKELEEHAPETYNEKTMSLARKHMGQERYADATKILEALKTEKEVSPVALAEIEILLEEIAFLEKQKPIKEALAKLRDKHAVWINSPKGDTTKEQLLSLSDELENFIDSNSGEEGLVAQELLTGVQEKLFEDYELEIFEGSSLPLADRAAQLIEDTTKQDNYLLHMNIADDFAKESTEETSPEHTPQYAYFYRKSRDIALQQRNYRAAFLATKNFAEALSDDGLKGNAAYEYELIANDERLSAGAANDISSVKEELHDLAKERYVSTLLWDAVIQFELYDSGGFWEPDHRYEVVWPIQLAAFKQSTESHIDLEKYGAISLNTEKKIPLTRITTETNEREFQINIPLEEGPWKQSFGTVGEDDNPNDDGDGLNLNRPLTVTVRIYDQFGEKICEDVLNYNGNSLKEIADGADWQSYYPHNGCNAKGFYTSFKPFGYSKRPAILYFKFESKLPHLVGEYSAEPTGTA